MASSFCWSSREISFDISSSSSSSASNTGNSKLGEVIRSHVSTGYFMINLHMCDKFYLDKRGKTRCMQLSEYFDVFFFLGGFFFLGLPISEKEKEKLNEG